MQATACCLHFQLLQSLLVHLNAAAQQEDLRNTFLHYVPSAKIQTLIQVLRSRSTQESSQV